MKLKIIHSLSHLSPKMVEMWREPLNALVDLARRDADDWVETMADMYRDFPEKGCIRMPLNQESEFYKTLDELYKLGELIYTSKLLS